MASLQDIRRRIRSVRNTRKITKAMELVAGARLRRAQSRIEEMRPYADRMMELMAGTARAAASFRGLALMERRDVQTVAIVPITGDRGLAGKLLGAMKGWLTTQRSNPAATAINLDDVDKWIQERAQIAGQTASLTRAGTAASWR